MVLVVDDDEVFADTLKEVLERSGLQCVTAISAEMGLALLKETYFDVCFLDLVMPGIGGMGFLENYEKIQPDLKVVVLTGYPSGDTMRAALRGELHAKAHDYLNKPVENNALVKMAQELSTNLIVDGFRLNMVGRQLYHSNDAIHTTANEYTITKFLMKNVDKWFSYEEINANVFNQDTGPDKAKLRLKSQISVYMRKMNEMAGYKVIQSRQNQVQSPDDDRLVRRQVFSFQRKKGKLV